MATTEVYEQGIINQKTLLSSFIMLSVNFHKGFRREIMLRYELMDRQVHIYVHTLMYNHSVSSSAKIPFQIVAFCQRI